MLKGDVKSAIETHEMLYQVMQRHNFLPEAFTTDFQVRSRCRVSDNGPGFLALTVFLLFIQV